VIKVKWKTRKATKEPHLAMAIFTTERTTAFMPALSPPDVSTAIFIFDC